MTRSLIRCSSVVILLFAFFPLLLAQDALKSGPQKGEELPDIFHAFNINGKYGIQRSQDGKLIRDGRYHSLVAQQGLHPTVMIFADEDKAGDDANLMQLLQKVDEAITRDQKIGESTLGGFIVFLSPHARSVITEAEDKDAKVTTDATEIVEQSDKREKYFQKLEKRAAPLKHVIVTAYPPPGPKSYNLSKEAAITVILYDRLKVFANHAYPAGKLSAKDIDQISKEIADMVAKK